MQLNLCKMMKFFENFLIFFLAGTASVFALPSENECVAWLEKNARGNAVSREFLQENARLALAGTQNRPWAKNVPDKIFLEYILPYDSVGETPEPWRERFLNLLSPRVENCKTASEVAEKLNRELWDLLGVYYSPKRDKPDQSPSHSMRIGKASCTGLSILLIDACRAVGVPARFVSCNWPHKPGNHSWVEIYDGGQWFYLGAGDGGNVNHAWFDADTAMCENADATHAIYALTWGEAASEIGLIWNPQFRVPAENVTARYVALNKNKLPLCISIVDKNGNRVATKICVRDSAGTLIADNLTTYDDRRDLNDHLKIDGVPASAQVQIETLDDRRLVPVKSRIAGLLIFEIEPAGTRRERE